MISLIGLSGSLRKASYNSAVLRAAASRMSSGSELHIESIADIPLYNGDDEAANRIPDTVSRLKDAIAAADGLLLVTPEYNNSIPGVAKNAIDWRKAKKTFDPRTSCGPQNDRVPQCNCTNAKWSAQYRRPG